MRRNKLARRAVFAAVVLCVAVPAEAEEYACEVMVVEGSASVKEGDLLRAGDAVETAVDGRVDVAYDADFKNVARVEGDTKVRIKSVHPSGILLEKGSVFARLKELPKESTFEVETPTAIASVRGSEYRTVVGPDGATDVQNFSSSAVYVFGLDDSGKISGEPRVLSDRQASRVERRGMRPAEPRRLRDDEVKTGRDASDGIGRRVEKLRGEGRRGKIQDVRRVRREMDEKRAPGDGRRKERVDRGAGPPGSGRDRAERSIRRAERRSEGKFQRQDERGSEGTKKKRRKPRRKPPIQPQ